MTKHLIIGGSDAGISAALRIKELNRAAAVMVMAADAYPNFSICGLPFYISGEVSDWHTLAHRNVQEIEKHGIRLLLDHRALAINPETKSVTVQPTAGRKRRINYDKLLIATGAESAEPSIDGLHESGVFFLRWMADSFAVKRYIKDRKPQQAVIIGGGYIGLEMADALTRSGMTVTLVEFATEILTTLDTNLGRLIRTELESKGVTVHTEHAVDSILRRSDTLIVKTVSGKTLGTDMVIVAAGATPSTTLAQSAGIPLGAGNAIRVNRAMATQVRDVWAAGDCVQTWHRLLQRNVYMPLGTTAHKQGRVAGENMLGGRKEYQGSLGTQVVKVFDRIAARTGLCDKDGVSAGFDTLTVGFTSWDHKNYYPGAKELHIRITGDRSTGKLLGAQMVGHRTSEVSKRIDILATALFHGMRVEEMCDLDLSYTPPLSSPWDPIQMAAFEWCRHQHLS